MHSKYLIRSSQFNYEVLLHCNKVLITLATLQGGVSISPANNISASDNEKSICNSVRVPGQLKRPQSPSFICHRSRYYCHVVGHLVLHFTGLLFIYVSTTHIYFILFYPQSNPCLCHQKLRMNNNTMMNCNTFHNHFIALLLTEKFSIPSPIYIIL